MCNEAARRIALDLIRDDFSQVGITLIFPEGAPNLAPLDSIRITDTAAIVRCRGGAPELVQRRWSWGGAGGKPVYNFRSEGRRFDNSESGVGAAGGAAASGGRCLIPLDGFYEFTDAPPGEKRKAKWLFTLNESEDRAAPGLFCVAGLWRSGVAIGSAKAPATGEAWTMLTCQPGPDIAPYHARQIVIMPRASWADWLGGVVPAADLIAPTPAGTLRVAAAR